MQELVHEIAPMGNQNQRRQKRNAARFCGVVLEIMHDEGQTGESEEAGQHGFAQESERAAKEDQESSDQMIIVNQNDSEGCGHAFAATEKELDGPDVAGHDGKHRDDDDAIVSGEMARGPNGENAFEEIAEYGDHEARPAH